MNLQDVTRVAICGAICATPASRGAWAADLITDIFGDCDPSNLAITGQNLVGHPTAGAPRTSEYHVVTLDPGGIGNPVCNDGTPPVMFIRTAIPGSDDWYIHFQGGGGCASYDDCKARWDGSTSPLTCSKMSSDRYGVEPDEFQAIGEGGILHGKNPKTGANTVFRNYNRVIFHYCSSDGWIGDTDTPKELKGGEQSGDFTVQRINGASKVCLPLNHGYEVGELVTVTMEDRFTFDVTDVPITWKNAKCFAYGQPGLPRRALMTDAGNAFVSLSVHFNGNDMGQRFVDQLLMAGGVVSDDGLVALPSMADATSVIVGGDSAGSAGARHHAPYISDLLQTNTVPIVPRFVLDASVSPSHEREDVNGVEDSCDLYDSPDPLGDLEAAPYQTPADTYDQYIDDLTAFTVDVWEADTAGTECDLEHPPTGPPLAGALPPEVCTDPHHLSGEHFRWELFERQNQDDNVLRPKEDPADCSDTASHEEEWADLVAEHFDVMHHYVYGDQTVHSIATVERSLDVATVCLTAPSNHQYAVGDSVTVRGDLDTSFNVNAVRIDDEPAPDCFSFAQVGDDTIQTAETGTVRLALATLGSVDVGANDIAPNKIWYLGEQDAFDHTGVPFATPPYYQSFSSTCSNQHDIVLDSDGYFYEEIEEDGVQHTFAEEVEKFVLGTTPDAERQLQDDWAVGRGTACCNRLDPLCP